MLHEKYDAAANEANALLRPGLRASQEWDIASRNPETGETKCWHVVMVHHDDAESDEFWETYDQADEVGSEPGTGWTIARIVGGDRVDSDVHTAETLAEVLRLAGLTR